LASVAKELGVEVVTVKRHVGNILRKLGAWNRTHAAVVLAESRTN
jgi:DNA-binding NarL/FixJ family response regulator